MLVRLEEILHLQLKQHAGSVRQVSSLAHFLLAQAALICYVFAIWRLTADMNWTGEFFVSVGILSHWIVWLALGILIQCSSFYAARTERMIRQTVER